MALSVIEQGKKLFNRGKYTEVISSLEPHVLDYRDSFTLHFYLGLSFLYIGEIPSAMDYLARARQLKPTDPDMLSCYAILCLRRSDTTNAVEYYLQALEINPNYKLAKKGLNVIRKNNSPEKIGNLIQSGAIKKLYPRPGRQERNAKFLAVGLTAMIVLVSALTIVPYIHKTRALPTRADLSDLELSRNDRKYAVDMEGTYLYVMTQQQILDAYANAQRYFNDRRDNAVQVEINRIVASNASEPIKQKARLLMDYLEEPTFDNITDIYSFPEVKAEPLLYLDCWVVWKGMPTDIVTGEYSTSFNLLVGYDTKQTLQGIVTVSCKFVSKIDTDRPVSVLGKISMRDNNICLEAKGIYQSQKPAENE